MSPVDEDGIVPMTRDEITALLKRYGYPVHDQEWLEQIFRIIRIIEREHGIEL